MTELSISNMNSQIADLNGEQMMRAEVWASRINEQTRKSVEAILDVGRMLVRAKAELSHGEWGRLFADQLVPYSIGSAERLMKIAEHPQLSNSAHVPNLPAAWGTLYELTKVEPKQLEAAIAEGRVTPAMERKDVAALRIKHAPTSTIEPTVTVPPMPSTYQWVDEKNSQLQKQRAGAVTALMAALTGYEQLTTEANFTITERRTARYNFDNDLRHLKDRVEQVFGGPNKSRPRRTDRATTSDVSYTADAGPQ